MLERLGPRSPSASRKVGNRPTQRSRATDGRRPHNIARMWCWPPGASISSRGSAGTLTARTARRTTPGFIHFVRVTGAADRLLNQRFVSPGEVDRGRSTRVTVIRRGARARAGRRGVDVLASVVEVTITVASGRIAVARFRQGRHPRPQVRGSGQPRTGQREVLVAVTDEPRAMPLPAIVRWPRCPCRR